MVLHVRDEYDTVMETVLKTEFLTLLSEKFTTLTKATLPFTFNRRWALVNAIAENCKLSSITSSNLTYDL